MKLSRSEFDAMALQHMDMLYRLARRMTRDDATAQDLVQETYVRAFVARDTFDLQEFGIRPWLIRILHNQGVSRFRREQRQPVTMDDEHLDAMSAQGPEAASSSALELMDQRIATAVKQLPEQYQMVIMLWAVDDM